MQAPDFSAPALVCFMLRESSARRLRADEVEWREAIPVKAKSSRGGFGLVANLHRSAMLVHTTSIDTAYLRHLDLLARSE